MSEYIYKTSEEILDDICALVENTPLEEAMNGKIYQEGFRPRDSKSEDLVVIYTAGVAKGEIVTGELTFNLYVPDIQPYKNGVYVRKKRRLSALSQALQSWIASQTLGKTEYKLSQLEPIKVVKDREINQHLLVLHVQYEYCVNN